MQLREATPEERLQFYKEEWNKRDLPDFILHTLSLREFGFDLDGTGPSHRYNQFMTVEQLADFLRNKAPYAAYASVALYEQPSMRKGWLKSELVFDVDAKDLPLKSCSCVGGAVCEQCLNEARQVAIQFAETMRSDLDLHNINFVFSGRGFHIRVTDESVMAFEQAERAQLVEYITGCVIPTDVTITLGYSRVFRGRVARTFERLDEQRLLQVHGMRNALAQQLVKERERVLTAIRAGRLSDLENYNGMGPKTFRNLLEFFIRLNSEFTDGKVTIDTKRILRLPSSLHSGVSMKCMLVRDMERFSIEEAAPKFVRERMQ
ncbi:MAG: DNA primase catalytic subunit PriS [Candidatus Hodarchaeaceae archaeon]|nr:DNA primase catalytic subunit PriS [Candidatus Hodarchaeaceae archaeon]